MRLADALRPHEQQAERLRHGILADEFFRGDPGDLRRPTPVVEIIQFAVLIAAGDICVRQETFKARAADALTPNHARNAVAFDSIPSGSLTFRANDLAHTRIVLETEVSASSSNRAAVERAESGRAW